MKNLEEFRRDLDIIDKQILELLSKRVALSHKIALYKKAYNIPVVVPERERVVLHQLSKTAPCYGLDEDFVFAIFKLIIDNSSRIQIIDKEKE